MELPIHSTNTISIESTDGKGGTAYRNFTFRMTNTALLISGQDENVGDITEVFSKTYIITDSEGGMFL